MKIALVQFRPEFGESDRNIERLLRLCKRNPADLYILPELAYTGYQFASLEEVHALADSVHSRRIEAFRNASKELDACLIFGFPELAGAVIYNSALAVLSDGREFLYRKTHLFYKETLYFSPGDTGFPVFEYRGARIGMAICFDWFFPESFRTLALKSADIIAHCSNLVLPYCQTADFAAAVQNRVFIATVNRVGTEQREDEQLVFTGESVLVSPKGEYLLRGPIEDEAVLVAEIDPEAARNKSINPYNEVFKMRRPGMYTLQ
jgi:predicted amidohydrolase